MDLGRLITGPVERIGTAAQNALEVARFGGLETGEEPSPSVVVRSDRVHRLRRYFTREDWQDAGPPVLLVPPLMLAHEVYDVSPATSAVRLLHDAGMDTWVVDFGAPEREEGGLERTLADHVLAVSDAIDAVRGTTGRDVHLAGYSQGGMFCYQTAAVRRSEGIASVITFGSPVDTRGMVPFGLPEELATRFAGALLETLFGSRNVPAWVSRNGFRLLDPVKATRQQLDFLLALHDREALLPREKQRRFLQADGFVAWPGPALADFMRQFVVHNRMLQGGFLIEDRLVTLADIRSPILTFIGTVDEFAPPASVRPIARAAPQSLVHEIVLQAGHFGLVVGSKAVETTWPVVADWARFIEEGGEPPEGVVLPDPARTDEAPRAGAATRATHAIGLAAEVGVEATRTTLSTAGRAAGALRDLGTEAVQQLPRLMRLERVRPTTRVSLGLLLDEQARRAPGGICFLFEDRAHTHEAAKHRIDAVVRGLLSLGVRQGEHVGVLMDMRPSALVVVAALNRLGAVAVLLRPGGDTAREAELGRVARIVADPERIEAARETGAQVLVLGGGAAPRDLGADVVDMERIDPEAVGVPGWYRPNPGLARDLAFVLFTGEGERIRVNRITNRRWALSAFGTASGAALDEGDTVYSVTPVHHPSGLLTALGGAIAGGARIALARSFDPATFWEEVRRYGVTVVSYTWTMLRELVDAPEHPLEHHHPVRLVIGSGMPPGLWQRVEERFAPARVVEFYVSTPGEAILVNLKGRRAGAGGRSLPGAPEVRIAAWDTEAGKLVTGDDGFAVPATRGVLLVKATAASSDEEVLRGVFRAGDAWISTGDLFECAEDGTLWLVDPVPTLVDGVAGSPARRALGAVDAVDLAVTFGLGGHLVAAVAPRPGREVRPEALTAAVRELDDAERPVVVRVVDEVPVTTWYRPQVGLLRAEGVPAGATAFAWDGGRRAYRPLTTAARRRLGLLER
jgi:putative long chain acyl-CoA synthase